MACRVLTATKANKTERFIRSHLLWICSTTSQLTQPCTQASSCYLSYQRRLGTECDSTRPGKKWQKSRLYERITKKSQIDDKKSQIILDENPLFSATITVYFELMRLIHLFRASLDRFN